METFKSSGLTSLNNQFLKLLSFQLKHKNNTDFWAETQQHQTSSSGNKSFKNVSL
jgi:hypothetical protein